MHAIPDRLERTMISVLYMGRRAGWLNEGAQVLMTWSVHINPGKTWIVHVCQGFESLG